MILRGNIYSKTLEMETGITVVTSNKIIEEGKYKVAYLLHGLCGRNGDLADYTMLPVFANNYNIIFIMPEVARSFYTDMKYGLKYFSYITEELPIICKSIFNISSKREDTIIMGASMGGYGALKSALSKPEQYGYCCAFSSPCLYLKEALEMQRMYGHTEEFKQTYGEQMINDFHAIFGSELKWDSRYEIMELAKKINHKKTKPIIYATCGTKDYLREDNIRFREEMKMLDFDFIFEEWEGNHDWYFFNESIKRALKKTYLR
ncbi:alpha/beta hydrolase [Orenia marismortui]|uniref:S-formylglutathione hydrolase FrmB n=1 Tax=Orenia marismortui TaxID=46469 RepID=A0A4R8GMP5_9FIRM|nr:alpha/beta hydrolase-fold protein [Orenia marismortui]TDX44504.1 S-formylglutathione hydrolase FrmB [Orenia marismortui]